MNQKEYQNRVAELGCLICGRPAELHHTRYGVGMGQRGKEIVPLCPYHHRQGPFGEAIHNGYYTFAANHLTEVELIEKRDKLLRG